MKMKFNFLLVASFLIASVLFTSCSSDNDQPNPRSEEMEEEMMEEEMEEEMEETVTEVDSKEFDLSSVADPNISGTAKFISKSDNSLTVELKINGTPAGGMHPAHIHFNTAVEGGDIALTLGTVNGDTGESSVDFTTLDDGTAITYAQLLEFDGYINVHLSAEELPTLVAQGDIGQNELTGESKEYVLNEVDVVGIDGTAVFSERVNGEALAVITLNNTPEDGMHPGHIHSGSAAEGGPIIFSFNPVNGATGVSKTNVAALDDETAFGYEDVLIVDGYINIHLSMDDLATLVAQGNIGSNDGEEEMTSAINFDVTNQGASAYIFNGNGLSAAANPNITLTRGQTYTFTVNTPGHPFFIKSVSSVNTTNAYNEGVTNNGEQDMVITFVVPMDAPDTLFYNCEFHISMTGEFNIVD